MTVSIIIAVKTWQKNLEECVSRCLELDYPDFEILVLPDAMEGKPPISDRRLKIVPTGPVTPPKKRDLALEYGQGEILAFLDDDAYPRRDWLKKAVIYFQDPEVAGVGGPGVTPESDTPAQKASGLVYASALTSGQYTYRYLPGPKREVDDYPSCNLFLRKEIFRQLGGFDTNFWPGEDTKLCLDITKKLKKKIIYDPEVLVYHHRRSLFRPHLKQIASYALHRGYFAKRFPETSRKLAYFIPTLFVLGLLGGFILSVFSPFFRVLYGALVLFYSLIILFAAKFSFLVSSGIVSTHITYGVYFIKGLFARKLAEEKEQK